MILAVHRAKLKKAVANAKAFLANNYVEQRPEAENANEPEIRYSISLPSKPATITLGEILSSGHYSRLKAALEAPAELTFVEKISAYIQQKELRETTIYKAAQMDRRLFSKVMADREYKPSKDTALALAFALQLNLDEAKDLLDRAGYSLSRSSQRDTVMEFFFKERIFDLNIINYILSELQMKCIGR